MYSADKETVAFEFKNEGVEEVRIDAVKASCRCVSGSAKEKIIAPGATSKVEAVVVPGGRLGVHNWSLVVVSTAAGKQSLDQLKMKVDIKQELVLNPSPVTWAKDESPVHKTVTIKPAREDRAPLSIVAIKGGAADFEVAILPSAEGSEATFIVTPASTAKPARKQLFVTVRDAKSNTHQLIIFAAIQPN